jgi:type IX secretion system PorP/SprF family membrane protein
MCTNSNMRKISVIIFALVSSLGLQAQQRPHYTQYILNNYVLNPALTGIENYTDVKLSHRLQWAGLDGAPVTSYVTIHGPLKKKDYRKTPTSFSMKGENPRGKNYWEDYTATEPHHGIGLSIVNDKTGALNWFNAQVSYAYHMGLTPRTSFSAGIAAGVQTLSLNRSKLNPLNPVDQALGAANANLSRVTPDISIGVWMYSADYFLGVSAQQILPQKIRFAFATGNEPSRLVPHFFLTGGYRFLLNDDFNVLPSALVKYVTPGAPLQFETNVKLQYLDRLWVGGSYRYQDGYAAMAGLNISNTFNVGYSYDFTTSRLNTVSRGTHEIVLGFLLGNTYGDMCPKNVW